MALSLTALIFYALRRLYFFFLNYQLLRLTYYFWYHLRTYGSLFDNFWLHNWSFKLCNLIFSLFLKDVDEFDLGLLGLYFIFNNLF